MAAANAEEQPHSRRALRPVAWPLLGGAALILAGAWAVTIASMGDVEDLAMRQLEGASPVSTATFVALTGVMMAAMMLPSALPMIEAHRGIVTLDRGPARGLVESAVFGLGYLAVWTAMTALSLPTLAALSALPQMGGAASYLPGGIVAAAGAYQFTGWKRFCLRRCRSPVEFISTHYRAGRVGALSMGIAHGAYCLGCCWLIMLVWFVAGAMSLLWMGVFAALILAEKAWARGELLSRSIGLAALAAGSLMLLLRAGAPVA